MTYTDEAAEAARRIIGSQLPAAGGQYREAYNGHVNRETWNTLLWMQNDEGLYERSREIVREACDGSDYDTRNVYTREQDRRYQLTVAGDALREWWDELNAPTTAGPLSDAWTYALAWVDWLAVAESVAEGMADDPTEH